MGNTFHSTARQLRISLVSPKKPIHPNNIMKMYTTLFAALTFVAYASAGSELTEAEIDAWFNLVDTNNDNAITSAELDTANKVFNAKCQLPREVDAKEFLAAVDKDGNGCLDEQELDDDFHPYGELVEGETHAYMLVLDTNQDACVSLDEMEAGVMTGKKQCEILEDISAKSFQDNGCMDNGEVHETEFSDCLHTIENEVARRRRR